MTFELSTFRKKRVLLHVYKKSYGKLAIV